ncbi:MAG: glutathione S-transferase [Verrucomicrobiaceae bacterium]|nr:glutathione S-transferase [Verrucomicrobiaceae bacterium]
MPASALPIFYTFRRCPYAMRARLAITVSGVAVEWREIVLRNKPKAMLAISPKGTVPVLQLPDGLVIDESLDIMQWALGCNDPQRWLPAEKESMAALELIHENDGPFKAQLDRYKYADRHPEHSTEYYRENGEIFLQKLDVLLQTQKYLMGEKVTIVDMAIFPFIRQFAAVDKLWFNASKYIHVIAWLDKLLVSDLFALVMQKRERWVEPVE